MSRELVVRRATVADVGACRGIVEGLPTHFTPDVPDRLVADLARCDAWVLDRGDQVVGCCVVERRDRAADVRWIAVAAPERGHGLGRAMLARVLHELRAGGVAVVTAWTLDPAAGYAPYEATRAFWSAMGFVPIATIEPTPEWSPGSPAACYVAALAATVP